MLRACSWRTLSPPLLALWWLLHRSLAVSSYYALPSVLAWFTGYIGYHHIHHLSPCVPSYRVMSCHREASLFAGVRHISLRDVFACARLALWDEYARRLVSLPSGPHRHAVASPGTAGRCDGNMIP